MLMQNFLLPSFCELSLEEEKVPFSQMANRGSFSLLFLNQFLINFESLKTLPYDKKFHKCIV